MSVSLGDSTTIPAAAVIEFAVLLLSLVGIKRANCTQEESRLARLLRTQGIAYFLMVLLVQLSTIVSGFGSFDDVFH